MFQRGFTEGDTVLTLAIEGTSVFQLTGRRAERRSRFDHPALNNASQVFCGRAAVGGAAGEMYNECRKVTSPREQILNLQGNPHSVGELGMATSFPARERAPPTNWMD
jgi:hypothetical protein